MAKIPVEKKGGTPIWAWVLGLLLLAGLIWLLVEILGGDDEELVEDPIENVGGTGVAGGTITSLAGLREAQGRNAAVGREVDLENMRVESVVGDSSFFVTSADGGAGERLLVVMQGMGETGDPGGGAAVGADGEYNVEADEVVNIQGTIEQFTQEVGQRAGVTGADMDRLLSEGIYLSANQLDAANQLDVMEPEAL